MIYFNEQTRQFSIFKSDPEKKKEKLKKRIDKLKSIQAMSDEDRKKYYVKKGALIGATSGGVLGAAGMAATTGVFSDETEDRQSVGKKINLKKLVIPAFIGTRLAKNGIINHIKHNGLSTGASMAIGGTLGATAGAGIGAGIGSLYASKGKKYRDKKIARLEKKYKSIK